MLRFQPLHFLRAFLEHLHGRGHFANLIPASLRRDRDFEIAVGEPPHGAGHGDDGLRQRAAQIPGNGDTETETDQRDHHHLDFGNGDLAFHLFFQVMFFFGDQVREFLGVGDDQRDHLRHLVFQEVVDLSRIAGIAGRYKCRNLVELMQVFLQRTIDFVQQLHMRWIGYRALGAGHRRRQFGAMLLHLGRLLGVPGFDVVLHLGDDCQELDLEILGESRLFRPFHVFVDLVADRNEIDDAEYRHEYQQDQHHAETAQQLGFQFHVVEFRQ